MAKLTAKARDIAQAIVNEKDNILAIGCAPNPPILSLGGARLDLPRELDKVISLCEQAPFGQGTETVTDTTIRKVLQTDKVTVQFECLNDVISQVQAQICPWVNLTAVFYKLLVYKPGDFFACHRDSKKTNDHLATLVVDLGLPYRGGEIVFADRDPLQTVKQNEFYRSHRVNEDEEEDLTQSRVNWTGGAPGAWGCWFTSLWHAVLPLTHGTRVVATYNLMVDHSATIPAIIHMKPEETKSLPSPTPSFVEQQTSSASPSIASSSLASAPVSPKITGTQSLSSAARRRARRVKRDAFAAIASTTLTQIVLKNTAVASSVTSSPLTISKTASTQATRLPLFSSSVAKTTVFLNSPLVLSISLFLPTRSSLDLLSVNKQLKQCFPPHPAIFHSLSLLMNDAERLRALGRNKLGFPLRHTYSFDENNMCEPWHLKGRDRVVYDVLCSLRLQPTVCTATLIKEQADHGLVCAELVKSVAMREDSYDDTKTPKATQWLREIRRAQYQLEEKLDKAQIIEVPEYARQMLGGMEKVRVDQLMQFHGVSPDTEFDGDTSWDATYYSGVLWCATQQQISRCFCLNPDKSASADGLWGNAASFAMLAYQTGVMIVELFPMESVDLGLCTSALPDARRFTRNEGLNEGGFMEESD